MEDHSFIFLNNTHNSNIKNVYCDPLPLNSYIDEEYPIFGEINYNIFDFNKDKSKLENSSQILNKINKFEDTYYNNLKSFPNTEAKLHDKQILEKNLNLIHLRFENEFQPRMRAYDKFKKNYILSRFLL